MNRNAIIQLSSELGPIVSFLVAGQLLPFIGAVWVLMLATIISVAMTAWCHNRVPLLPLASAFIVLVSGGITVFLGYKDAVIIADSLYYLGLAAAIVVGFYTKQHFFEYIMDKTFAVTRRGWQVISWFWLTIFVVAGLANEYVRFAYSPEFWLDYRFTKILLLVVLAGIVLLYARQYRIEGESNRWGLRVSE